MEPQSNHEQLKKQMMRSNEIYDIDEGPVIIRDLKKPKRKYKNQASSAFLFNNNLACDEAQLMGEQKAQFNPESKNPQARKVLDIKKSKQERLEQRFKLYYKQQATTTEFPFG